MPCRNVLPKPNQKPHPPMWMACTNRDTIKVAAQNGLGVLAFSFADAEEARHWSQIYYDTIKSEECVPLGHRVNANIAMTTAFSLHHDHDEAVRRGQLNFEFFVYAISALVREDTIPGRTRLWDDFMASRDKTLTDEQKAALAGTIEGQLDNTPGIGTPEAFIDHVRSIEASGIDQVIFVQQAGRMKHEHICHSLELFASDVAPVFHAERAEREARKAAELAPYIEAAMKRKHYRKPLPDNEIPIVHASKPKLAAVAEAA
jgi:alkanesulfonate monooxygenase SsuD/methylene tetrahydromethanopterin reductase-like flavin-dependent oxidoreductase (luciferase family)